MFRFRGIQDSSGSVVIVNIDEKSLKEHGQWPWPRDLVANLTDQIFSAKPQVVGFDIMFAEKDRTSPALLFERYKDHITFHEPLDTGESNRQELGLDHDVLLAKSMQQGKSVQGYMFLFREDFLKETAVNSTSPSLVFSIDPPRVPFEQVQLITAYRPILNISELSEGEPKGFLNLFPDTSGTVRQMPLLIALDGSPYPSLSLKMFSLANSLSQADILLDSKSEENLYPLQGLSLGTYFFPTDHYGQMALNFRGPYNTFLYVSASDVLKGTESQLLKEKYVLVGSSAAGIMNLVATPFSSRLPGVEVHATALDNLINDDPMKWLNGTEIWVTYLQVIAGGLLLCFALVFAGPLSGLFLGLGIFALVIVGNYYFLFLNNLLLGPSFVVTALLAIFAAITLCNYLFEGRKRLFIRRAFSHYVAPSVVNELLKNPDKFGLQVDTREVTVLFCDIRNFTSLAENSSPEELSRFLNTYFSLMTEIILKNNGMVDKYIGDAVMAVWGSPLSNPKHGMQGVKAACEMRESIEQHSSKLRLDGRKIRIGIGINSGAASAGNFGCDKHFDYTVLGDNVNLASRVEELTKLYPVDILLTECTKRELSPEIRTRFIDRVLVKGRFKPVDLFEPLQSLSYTTFPEEEQDCYESAIALYRQGKFKQAASIFDKLQENTNDSLYRLYRDRCLVFLAEPPEKDWKGVYNIGQNPNSVPSSNS